MTDSILLLPIIIPTLAGLLAFFLPKKDYFTAIIALVNIVLAAMLFGQQANLIIPWAPYGINFSLRLYQFSAFIMLAAALFGIVVALYSVAFMRGRQCLGQYYAYLLITLGFVNGAVLADNLILLLFFWEGLLLTTFGMIIIGHKGAYKTAIKAFIINGITDLCMMIGIGFTIMLAGTTVMSQIHLPVGGIASFAFILFMIGAISKAGSMPFHSWIPDAAVDAPTPFMAFVPAALEKLLGIYLLSRLTLDLFTIDQSSWLSTLLMIIGSITILLAVMMALVQSDYKRLLSFHAISQIGYMILGIGTAVPAGIVGGIFHMLNHSLYKCGLFLTGGAVEKEAGTTDLRKLGGLASKMPITFACFFITAAAISGVPPFNGFFSKELVYDGAMERGLVFYIAAALGSFFTAASFLKLGHAAYFGKTELDKAKFASVKEAPVSMLIPMLTIATLCVLFGVANYIPLQHFIEPILGPQRLNGHTFAGLPENMTIVGITFVVIILAILNHLAGAKSKGSGIKALDHIHYAPVLHTLYDKAEARAFDPYEIALKLINGFSWVAWAIDRAIDFVYNKIIIFVTFLLSSMIRKLHTGSHAMYLAWSLVGVAVILMLVMGGF